MVLPIFISHLSIEKLSFSIRPYYRGVLNMFLASFAKETFELYTRYLFENILGRINVPNGRQERAKAELGIMIALESEEGT